MTAADFAAQFPKPWHFVMFGSSFSLRAANGAIVGQLQFSYGHGGVPITEYKRHVASAFSEFMPVIESSEVTDRRRGPIEQRLPALRLPAAEPPLEARKVSATPETPP